MRHLLTVIIGTAIAIVVFMKVDWRDIDLSLSFPSAANTAYDKQLDPDILPDEETEPEEDIKLWIDTVMYADGHAFGYRGDVSKWGGWYFDSICVGDEPMLTYDSVKPSTLKLGLVTRELTVDLADCKAVEKIRSFIEPIEGFRRFRKSYEKCLDSLVDEEHGVLKNMGLFSFSVDYPDSINENSDKISKFVCHLSSVSQNEETHVPPLSAFYAGYNPTKYYRPVYSGNYHDIPALSDFVANKIFENWILTRGGNFDLGSSDMDLVIRSHIANPRFVTFSKYEHEREGFGHGMYTETFHTLDLKTGNELKNEDIFKPHSLDKVKRRLFEVMAKDPKYLAWHEGVSGPKDVVEMFEAWNSTWSILDGTEWEEPARNSDFKLPAGALTNSGVVFSFQPYEIDCWAAGAYHFIVPYSKLMSCLTPEAKRLIKDVY